MLTTGLVRRKRMLPYRGEVLVKMGERVDPWTPVARIGYLPGKMTRIDVASELNVMPGRINEFMIKRPGDTVALNEQVARGTLFWEEHSCYSPVAGIVGLVSKHLGHAYVREPIDLGTTEPADVDVATALGVSPLLIGEFLNCSVGRMVAKDQPIASRRKSWGQPVTHVLSPTYGQVTKIDRQIGYVSIRPLFKSTDVLAYMSGEIVEILPDEGVVVQAFATTINGVFGVGGETFGELYVAVPSAGSVLAPDGVSGETAGRIVVGGKTVTPDCLEALKVIGAKALVVGYLPVETIQAFSPGLNMGITGKEDVPFTVIVTEGFREAEMSRDVFSTLQRLHGTMASCDGTTHIRAGVIRPEIIVPVHDTGARGQQQARPDEISVALGMRVRLLRRPYVGARGVVTGLQKEKCTLESGISAHTCTVRLDSGEEVIIPRSNCIPEDRRWQQTIH